MVSKLDAFKIHVLALDDGELKTIIDALYDADEDSLADELCEILDDEPESDIGTLTLNVYTSEAQKQVDALKQAAEDAVRAIDRLGGNWKAFNGGGW